MKIPETTPNVGAYYGNEENGQWQPNGVMLDSGVGGGVVGSGDAGMHRPRVYPMHIPRGHVPAGYVMAGAYYPPAGYPPPTAPAAPAHDAFADYMWMENEEEFDKQVMQQLEEEALMEQCIEAMLEDEQRERQQRPAVANGHNSHQPTTSNDASSLSLEETVSRSTLNPLAAEFVPTTARPPHTDEKQEPPEPPISEETQKNTAETAPDTAHTAPDTKADSSPISSTEAQSPPEPPADLTPEVSAADVTPLSDKPLDKRPPKDTKKDTKAHPVKVEAKKPVKVEIKSKVKPTVVKSETKVPAKKKEVKTVKSETKTEEKTEEIIVPLVPEVAKPQPTPAEETPLSGGFKPINYAAAAKANKPKKPSPPPADKTTPPPPAKTDKVKIVEKSEKKEKSKVDKPAAVKSEKVPVQRKNSAK